MTFFLDKSLCLIPEGVVGELRKKNSYGYLPRKLS
jgi:hypothetical protein